MDGISSGNPGVAGAGGILRDTDGNWIAGFAQKIGISTAVTAELWAVLTGLEMVWRLGHRQVVLELDFEVLDCRPPAPSARSPEALATASDLNERVVAIGVAANLKSPYLSPLLKVLGFVSGHAVSVHVADFIDNDGYWDENKRSFPVPDNIRDLLRNVPSSMTGIGGEDRLVWKYSSNGLFNTSSAYTLASGRNPESCDKSWLWLWKTNTIRGIQYFMWLACHNRLPTPTLINGRGFNIPSECSICKDQEETISHVLRECRVAQVFWNNLGIPTSKRGTFSLPIT
ncbi:hypothetical protein CRG98_020049 [Punica granatum]|uniref:RNase H type-1 domain-containing protein n=1 Tax=Punica granatum TaxID=22663 RepID=A0A2I0JTC8_PUNGR|nr:hypothetical protein CRG98_020049 [Punica granatum]